MPGPLWLQGPIPGVPELLQPAAHALAECREDVDALLRDMPDALLWKKHNGAASIGFHVLHSLGSLERLLTYARGDQLSEAQLAALAAEKQLDASAGSAEDLIARYDAAIERALAQLRATPEDTLLDGREVGRGKLPSNVLGILAHAGEHTYRHVGQAITTARLLRQG